MEQDFCTKCGEPIEEGELRQNADEEIICEDCFGEYIENLWRKKNLI